MARSRLFLCIASLCLAVACSGGSPADADSVPNGVEDSAFRLDHFVPLLEENGCEVTPGQPQWYTRGFIDVYFTDRYALPFRLSFSPEVVGWRLDRFLLTYELPPLPGIDPDVWRDRAFRSVTLAETREGVTVGSVDILTAEMHRDLLDLFALFRANGICFDWETYPLVITVQAAVVRPDSEWLGLTNQLRFELVPLYGESVRNAAVYPDKGWPSDLKIEQENPLPQDQEWAKYQRDKEIYDTMMLYCDFAQDHLAGCLPGQDYGMIDCYTFTGADELIEALLLKYNCCPREEPQAPETPDTDEAG